jgi:hypothetical protein
MHEASYSLKSVADIMIIILPTYKPKDKKVQG